MPAIAAGRPDADVTRANFEAELEAEKVAKAKKSTRKKGSAPGRVTVGTEGIIRHSRYNQLGRSFAEQVDDFKAGLIPQGEDLIVGSACHDLPRPRRQQIHHEG